MFRPCHNMKIINVVIKWVKINMMDYFTALQFSTKVFFNFISCIHRHFSCMITYMPSSINANPKFFSILFLPVGVATATAKSIYVMVKQAWHYLKYFATIFTSPIYLVYPSTFFVPSRISRTTTRTIFAIFISWFKFCSAILAFYKSFLGFDFQPFKVTLSRTIFTSYIRRPLIINFSTNLTSILCFWHINPQKQKALPDGVYKKWLHFLPSKQSLYSQIKKPILIDWIKYNTLTLINQGALL